MLHVPHQFSERTPTNSCEPAAFTRTASNGWRGRTEPLARPLARTSPASLEKELRTTKPTSFQRSARSTRPSHPKMRRQADLPRKGRPSRRRIPAGLDLHQVTRSCVRLADAPRSTEAPRARCLERASLHLPPRRTRLPSEEARSRRPSPSTLRRATIESCPSLEEPHAEASSRERARRLRLVAPHRLSLRHTDRNTT